MDSPSAQGSGRAQLRRQVYVEKTGIWSPAWEPPPATCWPLPSELGRLQLPASRAKKPRIGLDSPTHKCIQTISKYFQFYLQNIQSIRWPVPGQQLCSHCRRSLRVQGAWSLFSAGASSPDALLLLQTPRSGRSGSGGCCENGGQVGSLSCPKLSKAPTSLRVKAKSLQWLPPAPCPPEDTCPVLRAASSPLFLPPHAHSSLRAPAD